MYQTSASTSHLHMHTGQAIRAESLRKSGVTINAKSKPQGDELSNKVSNGSDFQIGTSSEKDDLDDDWVEVGAESKVEVEVGSKVTMGAESEVEVGMESNLTVGAESKVEVEVGSNYSSSERD